MYILKKNIANKANYGGKRDIKCIRYIVIHFTANDGDHDESNANYFKKNIVKASAHYFVDDDSVTQSVPDDYIAYSVGGAKYSNCSVTGGGKYYKKCTNTNSISIELCDTNRNGIIYPTPKTIENAVLLTKELMKKYNIPVENVIRHFDVVGKACPSYWCGNAQKNKMFDTEFRNKLVSPIIDYTLVFNPTYYANRYPDLKNAGLVTKDQLLNHFIKYGMSEKRIASANFDINVYVDNNKDLVDAFGKDWKQYYMHFINYGHKENRKH